MESWRVFQRTPFVLVLGIKWWTSIFRNWELRASFSTLWRLILRPNHWQTSSRIQIILPGWRESSLSFAKPQKAPHKQHLLNWALCLFSLGFVKKKFRDLPIQNNIEMYTDAQYGPGTVANYLRILFVVFSRRGVSHTVRLRISTTLVRLSVFFYCFVFAWFNVILFVRRVPVLGVAKMVLAQKNCSNFLSLNTGYRAGLVPWVYLFTIECSQRLPNLSNSF